MSFVDVVDKTHFSRKRVKVFHGSQGDNVFLQRVAHESGMFDIIVDDGSHINEHQIETFKVLFPFLKDDGIYVIEDTQTSYWPSFGGGSLGTEAYRQSCTRFFLDLVDGLNYGEFLDENFIPSEFNKKITEISFHHNLIIIKKGDNEQKPVLKRPNFEDLKRPI
jgi:demethylmacrocin O-methyltransferase